MKSDRRTEHAPAPTRDIDGRVYTALRLAYGIVPLAAGLDKFFNLLVDWTVYISPPVEALLPFSGTVFMYMVGVIEVAVGVMVLTRWAKLGSYLAAAWLAAIAVNLILNGNLDIAVRDLVMAVGAWATGRLSAARAVEAPADGREGPGHRVHEPLRA